SPALTFVQLRTTGERERPAGMSSPLRRRKPGPRRKPRRITAFSARLALPSSGSIHPHELIPNLVDLCYLAGPSQFARLLTSAWHAGRSHCATSSRCDGRSLRLDARELDHLAPFFDLGRDIGAEFGGGEEQGRGGDLRAPRL